jgi:hypothetical protein
MSLKNLVSGVYGIAMELTVKQDTVAQDLSAYTAITFLFEDPDGTVTSKTGAFKTDGTDGIVKYVLADGDINQAGNWRVQVVLSNATASVPTLWLSFSVRSKLE